MPASYNRLFRRIFPGAAAVAVLIAASQPAATQSIQTRAAPKQDVGPLLQQSREVLEKYYEMERLIAKERADWELGKEILQDRIDLMKDQISDLAEKTKEVDAGITEADEEREKLVSKSDDLKALQRAQIDLITALEADVRGLLRISPEGLVGKVQALADRLPDPGTEKVDLSVSERYQNVLGILNETNKFAADLSTFLERRTLDTGQMAEVETLYLGLAKAYFRGSGEGESVPAGIGTPGPDAWVWQARPDHADAIRKMLIMQQNATAAEFVMAPVKVSDWEGGDNK